MFSLLDVDLSREKFSEIKIGEEEVARFIGGKGLATWLLYRTLEPGVDAMSSKNLLIFMAGPLSATPAPSSGRLSAVSKSPLTGTIADSHCGGYFALAMRKAGYLGVMLRGRAKGKVLLYLGEPELRDASMLWGMDTRETEREVKAQAGRRAEVLAIGRAGEKRVRFASVMNQAHRAFGRGGMGAVMGSKNLKAIVAGGNEKLPLAEREGFISLTRELHKKLAEHPATGKTLRRYGTPNVLAKVNYLGLLPTRNFNTGVFEHAERIAGEELVKYVERSYGCYGCAIRCGKEVKVGSSRTKSLEYETLYACGSNLGISSLEAIVKLNQACNLLGMDTISFGLTISSLIEGALKGKVDFDIGWGDGEKVLELAWKIANREGIGDELAEGSRAFWKSGEPSMSTKGMELPGYDPRGARGVGLSYATSNRGGCHLRAPVYVEEILAQKVDRKAMDGKARLVKELQDLHAAVDSLVLCKFTARALEARHYAGLFSLATGLELSDKELVRAGERIFNLERMMNLGEGFSSREDTLPERLLKDPLPEGASEGMKARLEKLEEYYRVRGWSKKGIPKKEKLEELGLP